ncbi:hypothetical protein ACN47E_009190 [Coniothyrium glycines]
MAPPSFARATISSSLRASPKIRGGAENDVAHASPKQLKRPSLLTDERRGHLRLATSPTFHPNCDSKFTSWCSFLAPSCILSA